MRIDPSSFSDSFSNDADIDSPSTIFARHTGEQSRQTSCIDAH